MKNLIILSLLLVLVVFITFKTDFFTSQRERCLEAVEKGKLVVDENVTGWVSKYAFKRYAYKGKLYQHRTDGDYVDICLEDTKDNEAVFAPQRSDEEYLNYISGIREKGIDWDQKDSKGNLDE